MVGQTKFRILVVGNAVFQFQAVRSTLHFHDYEVLATSTAEQAVAYCISNHVAAIVLNSEFVTDHGWSAAQTFKLINPHLPVLFLQEGDGVKIPIGVDDTATTLTDMLQKLQILIKRPSA
jgi:PleD family two-component response regulator